MCGGGRGEGEKGAEGQVYISKSYVSACRGLASKGKLKITDRVSLKKGLEKGLGKK